MTDYQLHCGDCLDIMPTLEAGSVDAIIADLPYGVTACHWDSVIPLEPLWEQYKRLIKPRGAVVLFGSQPFTSMLVMSNLKWFKYEWVWGKKYHTNPFIAKYQPLRVTESILVFSDSAGVYNPQMRKRPGGWMRKKPSFKQKNGEIFGKQGRSHPSATTRELMFPTNILNFPLITATPLHSPQPPA